MDDGPRDDQPAPASSTADPSGGPGPDETPAAPAPASSGRDGALAEPPRAFTLRLISVRSFLFYTTRRTRAMSGSVEALDAFYRKILIQNLILGWWCFPFGIVWTPAALTRNAKARRKLRELQSSAHAPAGWFPDPTGRHGARYWDGREWTDRVSDIGTDELAAGQTPATESAPPPAS